MGPDHRQYQCGTDDWMVAHCELCSVCCSSTLRTARSRTSGEYLLDVFIAPSSQRLESPVKPGWFSLRKLQFRLAKVFELTHKFSHLVPHLMTTVIYMAEKLANIKNL